ncbi:MAG TPA: SRPBCC domain-containing protein [Lacunisphaera sp.]|nr:SRPBCC domain-containing protein [Lacunisphaera sp.]
MTAKNKSAAGQFTLTRIFTAPRPLVFAAWTKPVHLKKWSAPQGFAIPVSRGELKPGGKWLACMVSPSGEKMWLGGVYREVVPDERLVFTHAWQGGGEETLVVVRFEDHPRGTKMTFTQSGFSSTGSQAGHKGGWSECFARLDALLAQIQPRIKSGRVSGRKRAVR